MKFAFTPIPALARGHQATLGPSRARVAGSLAGFEVRSPIDAIPDSGIWAGSWQSGSGGGGPSSLGFNFASLVGLDLPVRAVTCGARVSGSY